MLQYLSMSLYNLVGVYSFPDALRGDTIHESNQAEIPPKNAGSGRYMTTLGTPRVFVWGTDDTRSRWSRGCPSCKTPECPNARRISSSQQDSVPPELARECHKRSAHGSLFAVSVSSWNRFIRTEIYILARYANLYEVRLIPTKKDIAFVEYLDEGSATVAKDALHNYKLDGENKIKVRGAVVVSRTELTRLRV